MLQKLKKLAITSGKKFKAVGSKVFVAGAITVTGLLAAGSLATPSASAYTISPTNVLETGSGAVAKAAIMEGVEKTIDVGVDTAYTGWNFSLDVLITYLVWFIMLGIIAFLWFRAKRRMRL